ncbi:MAG: hypothetical protein A3D92_17960, partial [Bacteroidetes bacterium RIFCSPHIGHO2_02_FULL_44_7]
MANYKTPGVYVEEITKFPPSVAQVETAIPAFIGYTEKAEKLNGDTLAMIPKRITSILEYETYFGTAANEDTITVEIDDLLTDNGTERSIRVNQPSAKQPFLMYYSMQLYFANGGGPCYIISVGGYDGGTILFGDLVDGLAAVRKEDEPTLLLFPDATNLGNTDDFYGLYNLALTQCNELQDRFTIIDTEHYDEETGTPIEDLRDKISNEKDYIKYGAAYYPFLETILDYAYDEGDIIIQHTATNPIALKTAKENLEALSLEMNSTISGMRNTANIIASTPTYGTIADALEFIVAPSNFGGSYSPTNTTTFLALLDDAIESLSELSTQKSNTLNEVEAVLASINDEGPVAAATVAALEAARDTFLENFDGTTYRIDEILENLETLRTKLKNDSNATLRQETVTSDPLNIQDELLDIITYTLGVGVSVDATTDLLANIGAIVTIVSGANTSILDSNNGELNGRRLSTISSIDNATYNKIKSEINALPITLPPSSAMAGIYARIDSTRGVWKAPANVSLNYVIRPTVQISHEEQGDLNVHTTGKSINAIRAFTGKGN